MTGDRWRQVEDLFHRAADLNADERDSFLDSECGEDRELRQELVSLLEADAEPGVVVADAIGGAAVQLVREPEESASLAGQRIGRYTITGLIGKGGMGAVYLAVRDDDFRMEVAIKLLKRGTDTDLALSHFRRERQILAALQHPNIARLIDGGATEDGLPYFVMEYVDGRPLLEYVVGLSIRQRLELFRSVCAAVQYAHQNLVVHRDLKPGNILVTTDGIPKLLDFGIARLLDPEANESGMTVTAAGARLLTPEYASPEQVRGEPVTTASDVYSLGVVLFELLTGERPHRLETHSPAELETAICNREARRPSALNRHIDEDLDRIVLMALRKEPQRRYASAEQFAEDIRRYLQGEPVRARKDTFVYRTNKFMRRNRAATALATLAVLAVVAGVTGTLIQAHTARQQRDAAYRERDRANRISNFMVGMFRSSDPFQQSGNNVTAREILDRASRDISTGLAKDPTQQALMMEAMGNAYLNLGIYDRAEDLLRQAYDISRSTRGPLDPQTLNLMNELSNVFQQTGRFADAERLERAALDGQRKVLGPDHLDTVNTAANLGSTLAMSGRLAEAEALLREGLEKKIRILGPNDPNTAATMDNLAAALGMEGRLAESEELEARTIEIERRARGPEYMGTLMSMSNQADTLYLMGRYADAKQLLEQTVAIQKRVLGPNHPETARNIYNLGCLAARAGDREKAISLLAKSVDHLSIRIIPKMDNDPVLNSLHADPRFKALVERSRKRGATDAKCPL